MLSRQDNTKPPANGSGPSSSESIFSKRYRLNNPPDVFAYNGGFPSDPYINTTDPNSLHGLVSIYPDFIPWSHKKFEDDVAIRNLQKGCVEKQVVSKELQSARTWIHHSLKPADDKDSGSHVKEPQTDPNEQIGLDLLSSQMLTAFNKRASLNRVPGKSSFRPPPRVTLTEQKKELWLKNLADSSVSLRKLSRTIPHGIRNKTLLDQLISKKVPIERAIWLIKCIGLNELRSLRRKGGPSNEGPLLGGSSESDINETSWISEWTRQLTNYLENVCTNPSVDTEIAITSLEDSSSLKFKLYYLKELSRQLFIENLLNRKLFLTILIKKLLARSDGSNQPTKQKTNGLAPKVNDDQQESSFKINREVYNIYVLVTIIMKDYLGFILRKFITENYYSGDYLENSDHKAGDKMFYTNLLRTYIEVLIFKYDLIYKKFTLGNILSKAKNQKTNLDSDVMAVTPLSAYNRSVFTPTHPLNSGKTPLSSGFPQTSQLTSPYGLTSINSPFRGSLEEKLEEKSSLDGALLASNDKATLKLARTVKNLRKIILVTVKVHLMNLFLLNNGELFILPSKNWVILKTILTKYNILNTQRNNTNIMITSTVETTSPEVIKEQSGSETSSVAIGSPNVGEKKTTPSTGFVSNNVIVDEELYQDVNLDPNASEQSSMPLLLDSNSVLKHGMSFNVNNNNFIIKYNSKIILKKQFDIINRRNEALFLNITNSFKELRNLESPQKPERVRDLNHCEVLKGQSSQRKTNEMKIRKFMDELLSYEFFYLTEKRSERLSALNGLNRTFSITSNGSTTTNAPVSKMLLSQMRGKPKRAMEEVSDAASPKETANVTILKNEFTDKIDGLIDFTFGDFKQLIASLCSNNIPIKSPLFNEIDPQPEQDSVFDGIRKKLRILMSYCVSTSTETATEDGFDDKVYLIVYIIKCSISRFKSEVYLLNSNNIASGYSAKGSPVDPTSNGMNEFYDNEETTTPPGNEASSMRLINKKQANSKFKMLLQNELLHFIFEIGRNDPVFSSENDAEFQKLLSEILDDNYSYTISGSQLGKMESVKSLFTNLKKPSNTEHFLSLKEVNIPALISLIDSLIDSKIIALTTYIRKLISSGILYLKNLKSFHNLSLLQYIILRNVGTKINANGTISSNNITQLNFLMRDLKTNILNNLKSYENASIKPFGAGNHLAYHLIGILKGTEVSNLTSEIEESKALLQSQVITPLFEGGSRSLTSFPELRSLDTFIKKHISKWLFHQIQIQLSRETDASVDISSQGLILLYKAFSKLGKPEFFFGIVKIILAINIKNEFGLQNQGPDPEQQDGMQINRFRKVSLGYGELHILLRLLWSNIKVVNHFADYMDVEVEFQSQFSLVIKSINFKLATSSNISPRASTGTYFKALDLLKLIVNNYLKLNDVANSDLQLNSVKLFNYYDFIKFWRFFQSSIERYEVSLNRFMKKGGSSTIEEDGLIGLNEILESLQSSSLNNLKNQLAYLTTEPSFYMKNGRTPGFYKSLQGLEGLLPKHIFDKDSLMNCFNTLVKKYFEDSRTDEKVLQALSILKKLGVRNFHIKLAKFIHLKIMALDRYDRFLSFCFDLLGYNLIDFRILIGSLLSTSGSMKELEDSSNHHKGNETDKVKLTLDTSGESSIETPLFSKPFSEYVSEFAKTPNKNKGTILMLIYDLLSSKDSENLKSDYQKMTIESEKAWFEITQTSDFYAAILLLLNKEYVNLIESSRDSFEKLYTIFISEALKKNPELLRMSVVYNNDISFEKLIYIIGNMIVADCSIKDINSSYHLVSLVNEHNLDLCQLLTAVLVNRENDDNAVVDRLLQRVFMSSCIHNACGRARRLDLVCDLLVFLRNDLKLKLMNKVEILFLCCPHFPKLCLIQNEHGDFIDCKFNNFIPYVAIIVESVSSSLTLEVTSTLNESSAQHFHECSNRILMYLHHNSSSNSTSDRIVSQSVFVFLKMILIHKISIIYLLSKKSPLINDSLIKSLVSISKSLFIARHEQLRNMLYDFLFSVKSNLNELSKKSKPGTQTRFNFSFPKLNNDKLNIQLTKSLLYSLEDYDELVSQSDDRLFSELIIEDLTNDKYYDLNLRPFDTLEDTNPLIGSNDTSINLKLFGATLKKQNPA